MVVNDVWPWFLLSNDRIFFTNIFGACLEYSKEYFTMQEFHCRWMQNIFWAPINSFLMIQWLWVRHCVRCILSSVWALNFIILFLVCKGSKFITISQKFFILYYYSLPFSQKNDFFHPVEEKKIISLLFSSKNKKNNLFRLITFACVIPKMPFFTIACKCRDMIFLSLKIPLLIY